MGISTLQTLAISADGLSAQRMRMDKAAENIAHAETTRTPEGGPYRRQQVLFEAGRSAQGTFGQALHSARLSLRQTREGHRTAESLPPLGSSGSTADAVKATSVQSPADDVRLIYDPTHPDANAEGYVAMPNVEIITEMVDLMTASRAYEANITAADAVKSMVQQALDI